MLHRALQQFLADVFWGDLDVLLLDLPPGTGDIAISVAQLLPGSEIVVVTTPQVAAAEVAERAGSVATQTQQGVVGVVENMSWLEQPDGSRLEVFGAGGGERVAANLSRATGTTVPLLGQVPLDVSLREAGDGGTRSCSPTRALPPRPRCATSRPASRAVRAGSRAVARRHGRLTRPRPGRRPCLSACHGIVSPASRPGTAVGPVRGSCRGTAAAPPCPLLALEPVDLRRHLHCPSGRPCPARLARPPRAVTST